MKKTIFFALIIMMLVIPMLSAESYQIYKRIDIRFPFEVNGTIPSAAASCNLSVSYPNSSYVFENIPTTNQNNGEFNYTLNVNQVSEIGTYKWTAFCCDGSSCAAGYGEFEVTPTGFVGTLGFFILILVLSLGIMILGFSLHDAPIVILGSFGLYFISIYILNYGIDGFKDPVYTWAIGLIILSLAMYISVKSAYELIKDN